MRGGMANTLVRHLASHGLFELVDLCHCFAENSRGPEDAQDHQYADEDKGNED
jgi:hypothetical protein